MAVDDMNQIFSKQIRLALATRKLVVLICVIAILVVVIIGLSAALAHTMVNSSGRFIQPINESDSGPELGASRQDFSPQNQDAGSLKCPAQLSSQFSMQTLQSINPEVDYCENFYQYACGAWVKDNPIPPDEYQVSTFRQLYDENEERIRELLEEPVRRNTPESIERKVKLLYKMCLHDYGRSKQGGAPLVALIRQELGGWYGLDPDNWQHTWNMQTAFSKLQGDYLVDVFLKLSIGRHPANRKRKIIIAKSGGLGMGYYYYRDTTYRYYLAMQDSYQDYMRETVSLLLRDANLTLTPTEMATRVEQFVSDVYGHEKRMAEGMRNIDRRRDFWRGMRMSLEDLSTNYTQVDWKLLLEGMFKEVASAGYIPTFITADTEVYVRPKGYFDFLETVFLNETSGRDRIFNNYMVWRLLDTYSSDLSWEYMYAKMRFQKRRYGSPEFSPSWKRCVDMIRERLPEALAGLVFDKHTSAESKKEITTMVENIKGAYIERVEELDWMDNITKARAKVKMNAIDNYIIMPSDWFNNSLVEGLYHLLVVEESEGYFKSLLSTTHYERVFRILELAGSSYSIWMYALEQESMGVKPRYFGYYRSLLVPLGSVHIPLFSDDALKSANYGALGTATAKSLAGAINDNGRYQWSNGTYGDWWTIDSAASYMKAEICLSNYFTGIKVGPYMINGEEKMVILDGRRYSDRAVDLQAAIRAGNRAYLTWVTKNKKESGLGEFTAEQAFFLTAVQSQCTKTRDTVAYRWARQGFIPAEQMVNGVLTNMPEFAAAFNCTTDSKMAISAAATCEVF